MLPALEAYLDQRVAEFERITSARKARLQELSAVIQRQRSLAQPLQMTFICTHNSRRSHFAQLWGCVAAERFQITPIVTFSGGTEVTAFHPQAVAAIARAGFDVKPITTGQNPRMEVRWTTAMTPVVCFSKVFSEEPNPIENYLAVMVCSHADEACPMVAGATQRFALPYEDPKLADGTPRQEATYDERCAEIARELLYAFSLVR